MPSALAAKSIRTRRTPSEERYPGWVRCALMVGLPGMFWALLFVGAQAAAHYL